MQHPFQCIATVNPPDNSRFYLLAACGPTLRSISLDSGHIAAEWSAVDAENAIAAPTPTNQDGERPVKRQKTTSSRAPPAKDIIKLAVSPNHEYVLAVTEDKHVRVFSFSNTGHLSELSARCMPKRPCAIQVLPDNATILCGDKFGDVYSLPLLPDPNWQPTKEDDALNEDLSTNFKPSATNKTVHTQRNLKTLEAQQNQKVEAAKPKDSLNFKHELLLGHVSMLTDLAYTSLMQSGKQRNYIITADRDEHIRFSRGPPQSYIIEGYCLGHSEFVSKLCPLPHSQLLLSGGGDDWLGLWEWPVFRLRRRIQLSNVFGQSPAVSLLKTFELSGKESLLVGCERSAKIGVIPTDSLTQEQLDVVPWSTTQFDSPVLDIAFADNLIFLSFDAREEGKRRIGAYELNSPMPSGSSLDSDGRMDEKLQELNASVFEPAQEKDLDSLLYGIERLRKRDYHEEALEDE